MKRETVDAIIAAVGMRPTDRNKLAKDLGTLPGIARFCRNKPPSVKKIHTALSKVAKMIADNPETSDLEAEIAAILKDVCSRIPEAGERDLSPTDKLCGAILPDLFETHFGKRPGATRNGPYVKFASAALEAIGEKIQPETIIRSLTLHRKIFME